MVLLGKVKGDDIGIVVVPKELTVDLEKVGIGTEDILEFGKGLFFLFEKRPQKPLKPGSVSQGKGFQEIKSNDRIIHNFRGRLPATKVQSAAGSDHANKDQSKKMKRLSELEPGTVARIHSFEKNDLFLKLMEMGCVPGELVRVEQVAPLGDPISITVAGYNLSLRLDEAENIFMEDGGR